jgi:AcrR family transcriptional regulator
MGRWQPNAPQRLVLAALDLFAERGYESTTVIEIAERAGLTKSTFFRHFPDKREVAELQEREALKALGLTRLDDRRAQTARGFRLDRTRRLTARLARLEYRLRPLDRRARRRSLRRDRAPNTRRTASSQCLVLTAALSG